jgi:hypothetical protein
MNTCMYVCMYCLHEKGFYCRTTQIEKASSFMYTDPFKGCRLLTIFIPGDWSFEKSPLPSLTMSRMLFRTGLVTVDSGSTSSRPPSL